jgi:phosphatidylserine decarboxylase
MRGRARIGAVTAAAAGGAVCAFFRDPERRTPPAGVLAAADGVVIAVETEAGGRARVATFMRLVDVHVNRAPMTGLVTACSHRPGSHLPAFRKDSARNERMEWTFETEQGELRVVQIAGLVARRIVAYRRPGERVERGQRIGLIRFGSRVDVTLPPGMAAGVQVGDRVRAGRTRLDRDTQDTHRLPNP